MKEIQRRATVAPPVVVRSWKDPRVQESYLTMGTGGLPPTAEEDHATASDAANIGYVLMGIGGGVPLLCVLGGFISMKVCPN